MNDQSRFYISDISSEIGEYEIDVATDTSNTRVLKDKIVDESVFGNTTSFLTFKLFNVDGFIGLNFQ